MIIQGEKEHEAEFGQTEEDGGTLEQIEVACGGNNTMVPLYHVARGFGNFRSPPDAVHQPQFCVEDSHHLVNGVSHQRYT